MKRGFILVILLLVLAGCSTPEQVRQSNVIIGQYNIFAGKEKTIAADHNRILEQLRFKMGDKFSYRTSIDEYLTFVEKYKQDLLAFKQFLVENNQVLSNQGVDVDFVLKDLQNMMDTMDRNAKDFREWKINNPVTT